VHAFANHRGNRFEQRMGRENASDRRRGAGRATANPNGIDDLYSGPLGRSGSDGGSRCVVVTLRLKSFQLQGIPLPFPS